MRRSLRLAITLGLAGGLFFLIGARCVENDALRRGPDGNWHLYGELFNETDVQGVGMIVQGSIFDADGNLLSSATKPTCPQELSPGKPVVYDITFPTTNFLPEPASYKVTVSDGAALETPLPELTIAPALTVEEVAGNLLKFEVAFGPAPGYTGGYAFCLAFYDGEGDVIALPMDGFSGGPAGVPVSFTTNFDRDRLPGAVSMRFWIFATGDGNGSPFQTFVSFPIRLPLEKKIGATPQLGF
jgi:hypothetical protein